MRNEPWRQRASKTLQRHKLGGLEELQLLAQHPATGVVVRIRSDQGVSLVEKSASQPPPGFFPAQALGLRSLAQSGCVRVPQVLEVSEEHLLLEDLRPGSAAPHYWQTLGASLACLHRTEKPAFGFPRDTWCGAGRQPNPQEQDGHHFFAAHRLLYQGRLALRHKLLQGRDMQALGALCERLPQYIPLQAAVLLHGDLWSGNVLVAGDGAPALIDPACYWGWGEADLAMTGLFGGFPDSFYDAYEEAAQPRPGWRERMPLYNLYHLLNHLNLFGRQYYQEVRHTLSRYA